MWIDEGWGGAERLASSAGEKSQVGRSRSESAREM